MKTKFFIPIMILLTITMILSACDPVPAKAQDNQLVEPLEVMTVETAGSEPESTVADPSETIHHETDNGQTVAGWLGAVIGLPAENQFDDYLMLSPEGTGDIGVTGMTAYIEEQISALRDRSEPGKFAHFWGTLTCNGIDYNGCQLLVTRIRSGVNITPPEPVDGWEGTLVTSTFNGGGQHRIRAQQRLFHVVQHPQQRSFHG